MRSRWKIFITLIVVLPIVPVIWIAMMRSEGQSAVDTYRNSLIARGEKFEMAGLLPPPVPPEQNGADLVKQAAGLLIAGLETNSPFVMRPIAPGKVILASRQPELRDYYFTNSWTNATAFFVYNRPATELLKQALNYPVLDFHGDAEYRVPLQWAAYLAAGTICDLHNNDAAAAATNIGLMLAFVNSRNDAQAVFSVNDRLSGVFAAAGANWEWLQATNLTDAGLARLQTNWERLEFINALEQALLLDRAARESRIKQMRESSAYFDSVIGRGDPWDFSGDVSEQWENLREHGERGYAKTMFYASWTYSDELQMLQNDQLLLESVRTIRTNGCFNPAFVTAMVRLQAPEKAQRNGELDEFHWMFSLASESAGQSAFETTLRAEAARAIVVTAIALKRCQLAQGKYPPDLKSLAPEFLATVPRDPVDGKPLRYRLKADGTFLLYSIGLDGKDDGGDPTNPTSKGNYYWSTPDWIDDFARDWVWPQPATAAEVQNFYDHSPR